MKNLKKVVSKIGGVVLGLSMIGSLGQSAYAEGSRSMYPSSATGSRANIEWRSSNYANLVRRRTILKVYANAGEFILLGSSAVGVTLGATSGDIRVYNPNTITGVIGDETIPASPSFSCAAQRTATGQASQGQITTRTIELAGPDTITNPVNATPGGAVTNGYVPCFYQAPSTGIYDVVFWGPAGDNVDTEVQPTGSIGTLQNDSTQNTSISAWDVTVRNSLTTTTDINGRLFANYLALFTGANSRPVNSSIYIVTDDGFRYLTAFNGLDPNGFITLANNVGFYDSDGQTPLYRNLVDGVNNQLTAPQGGVTLAPPTHLIFFTNTNNSLYQPDPSAISANNIPLIPTLPTITGTYAGSAGGIDSYVSAGGIFTINSNVNSNYEIIISRDGVDFNPTTPANRVLRGTRSAGTHNIVWNGLDNSGTAFPVGTYTARSTIHAGEYHFPLLDVENSPLGGPTYTLVNPPDGTCAAMAFGCSTAFYDDRGYRTLNGTIIGTVNVTLPGGTPPPINNAALGFNSTSNQRAFSGGFGNVRGLDIWTYFPSSAIVTTVNIIPSIARDLTIFKSHLGDFSVGSNGVYTLQVRNTGTSAIAAGETITVVDTLPTGLTFVSGTGTGWTCNAAGQIVTCTNTLGGGGLAGGASSSIALTVSVGTAIADTVTNTSTVSVTNPATNDTNASNNTATDLTTILKPDVTVLKSHTGNFTRGSTGTYTITVRNINPTATVGTVTLADILPAGLTATAISGTGWSCTLLTVTCTRNDVLSGNSSYPPITLTVSIATDASSPVTNTANVSGGGETNTSNNTATDVTTIDGPRLFLVKRITAINGVDINGFADDPTTPNDTDPLWPTPAGTYLRGAITCTTTTTCNGASGAVSGAKPNDTVEYTIYFLSTGSENLRNLRICDRIPTNTTFEPDTYASLQGILLGWGVALPDPTNSTPSANKVVLTNSTADLDKGRFFIAGSTLPNPPCGTDPNDNGGVVVDVVSGATTVPFATASGVPIPSYGFVRFNVRVN